MSYLDPEGPSFSPHELALRGFALTAPAVAWAHAARQVRLGLLVGDRLLLVGGGGLEVLRLDLPLAGTRPGVAGTFVGMAGQVACFLQGSQLYLADVETGGVRSLVLSALAARQGEPAAEGAAQRLQAAVDGLLVYAAGPGGILCLHARTGHRVFHVEWPPELLRPGRPAGAGQPAEGGGAAPPPMACVADGVLYVTFGPSQVVALVERDRE